MKATCAFDYTVVPARGGGGKVIVVVMVGAIVTVRVWLKQHSRWDRASRDRHILVGRVALGS